MKIVINGCYGGFGLSKRVMKALGIEHEYEVARTDKRLIELVERCGSDYVSRGDCTSLEVVEIPDEATDWTIREYDGLETIIYVVDGKLHYA